MHKAITVAALAAVLTFANFTGAKAAFVINDDDGGPIDPFIMWYKRLRDSGTPVVLRGVCVSACGFVLILPKSQVCVEPTASIGFHMASRNEVSLPDLTAALIRRWYPLSVRKWLATKELSSEPIYMTADEIVKLGVFPACDAEKQDEHE